MNEYIFKMERKYGLYIDLLMIVRYSHEAWKGRVCFGSWRTDTIASVGEDASGGGGARVCGEPSMKYVIPLPQNWGAPWGPNPTTRWVYLYPLKVLFSSDVGHKLFHKLKPLVTIFKGWCLEVLELWLTHY